MSPPRAAATETAVARTAKVRDDVKTRRIRMRAPMVKLPSLGHPARPDHLVRLCTREAPVITIIHATALVTRETDRGSGRVGAFR